MLDIADELKLIYKNDIIPQVPENVRKELTIIFPDLDITINNDKIVNESFSLEESLCSDTDLTLGSCEAAQLKITVADIIQEIKGYEFTVLQTVDDRYVMPLGTYIVESAIKQSDRRFKEITAYDSMKKTDKDVASWYNGLTFPISVKNMRISLLNHLGIGLVDQSLPNDNITLDKTVNPSSLVGRDVLKRLCELNGGFGHITRDNKFKVILLSGLGLYPSETLYPMENLFPAETGEYLTAGYRNSDYEEYIVDPITAIKIRQDDEDNGTIVGDNKNVYIITGNFLIYGKSSVELQTIANNILLAVRNKYYRPHTTTMIGLPYMEVGDAITIITSDDAIETFIFKRTLKGIQSLTDEISASGNQKRSEPSGINTDIQQLKGKTLKIVKSIEELSSTITDVEKDLESQIRQQAGEIELKVNANGIIAAINLSEEAIKISADKINITGYVTFNDLSGNGTTTINGANIKTGTIQGVTYKTIGSRGAITMQDGYFNSVYNNESTWIEYGFISVQNGTSSSQIASTYIDTPEIRASSAYISALKNVSTVNGSIPITMSNIGSQIVAYANQSSEAGYASKSGGLANSQYGSLAVYVSSNTNFRPVYDAGSSCGTLEGRWSSVWAVNGTIQTSDERKKTDISELDERFLKFVKMIIPYTYKMVDGTSGRNHIGFIAQRVEEAMNECGISDQEFAGLVKAPVYAKKLPDGEYDSTSEIIDYSYHLRYDEFIPLIFLWLRHIENRVST